VAMIDIVSTVLLWLLLPLVGLLGMLYGMIRWCNAHPYGRIDMLLIRLLPPLDSRRDKWLRKFVTKYGSQQ
jgi:hypothetical protein